MAKYHKGGKELLWFFVFVGLVGFLIFITSGCSSSKDLSENTRQELVKAYHLHIKKRLIYDYEDTMYYHWDFGHGYINDYKNGFYDTGEPHTWSYGSFWMKLPDECLCDSIKKDSIPDPF